MTVTLAQLQQIAPHSPARFADWVDALNAAMDEFEINTDARVQMFIAQVMHESAGMSALVENLNYSASALLASWSLRFDAASAAHYARNPEAIANKVYADRMGNGNEASGDGWKYRGRGLIQITGKSNYSACGDGLSIDCIGQPELLGSIEEAARSAAWFWDQHGLNQAADAGDFDQTTRVINGGSNGAADRHALYTLAQQAIQS